MKEYNPLDLFTGGYFYIKFSNIKNFNNGNRVIEYISNDFIGRKSWKLKEYQNKGHFIDPLINENMYNLWGYLKREVYKDKITEEWIDKGAYIDISDRVKVEIADIQKLMELRDLQKGETK